MNLRTSLRPILLPAILLVVAAPLHPQAEILNDEVTRENLKFTEIFGILEPGVNAQGRAWL